jgi:hypothetical protein
MKTPFGGLQLFSTAEISSKRKNQIKSKIWKWSDFQSPKLREKKSSNFYSWFSVYSHECKLLINKMCTSCLVVNHIWLNLRRGWSLHLEIPKRTLRLTEFLEEYSSFSLSYNYEGGVPAGIHAWCTNECLGVTSDPVATPYLPPKTKLLYRFER